MLMKKNNIYFVVSVLALATLCRNLLELAGLWTNSRNFCCFYFTFSSFLNTFSYCLLLIFVGAFWLHLMLKGNPEQLRLLVHRAAVFLLIVFIAVPLVNLAFNYHGFLLPIWYHSPFFLTDLYLPMGCLFGFLTLLSAFPQVLKKIYTGHGWLGIFTKLCIVFTVMFVYTYQIGLWLICKWNPLHSSDADILLDLYSVSFLVPVLCFFPRFIREFFDGKDKIQGKIVYAGIIFTALFLAKECLFVYLQRGGSGQ